MTNEPTRAPRQITRSTPGLETRSRSYCSCDAIGSGVCPECQGIKSRKGAAELRRRRPELETPAVFTDPVASDDGTGPARTDIADRLRSAASMIESGGLPLDDARRLIRTALERILRLEDGSR